MISRVGHVRANTIPFLGFTSGDWQLHLVFVQSLHCLTSIPQYPRDGAIPGELEIRLMLLSIVAHAGRTPLLGAAAYDRRACFCFLVGLNAAWTRPWCDILYGLHS